MLVLQPQFKELCCGAKIQVSESFIDTIVKDWLFDNSPKAGKNIFIQVFDTEAQLRNEHYQHPRLLSELDVIVVHDCFMIFIDPVTGERREQTPS
uniref:BACK domain-containing protein n=1 Tax=Steinernema glaseri TaxID=37863 RepID=A0A1I8ASY2_9BILA